jgi:hypothetical protein
VLYHLDDIASDLSAIHRIDDMWTMDARRFYRLVTRLPAYQGVMRMTAERQARDEEKRKERQGLAGMQVVPIPAGAGLPGGLAGIVDISTE